MSEVKNVEKQSYTQQIKDYQKYAEEKGLDFDLYTRKDTEITKPLREVSDNGQINIIQIIDKME